jgi:serine/threonine protein kinase
MDYETGDGSQFSLREEWSEDQDSPRLLGTLITAFVDGNAYAGRSTQPMDDLDDHDVFELLEPIPAENIFPPFSDDLTEAPPFDIAGHYLKAPQFTYEDREPGRTFVADRMRNEALTLERLMKDPHPSLATYHGCVVKDGRITHLCLSRCMCNLVEYQEVGLAEEECERILKQVKSGLQHLHSLGIAHNDLNPGELIIHPSRCHVLLTAD